jgi:prolyl 4-hydroxylase
MEERRCFRSCLYCRTHATDKDLFLRGVDQTIKEVGNRPSPREVAEVMAKSERYFVDEVLVNESLGRYRLECRNEHALCAFWAAQGECESSPGEMGENCAAACQNCPLVDFDVRCPIDTSTNIFKPGDINAMFERLLKEAGHDVTSFSKENLPTGGSVPGIGELTVITSPYHDPPRDNDEKDEEDEEEISPLPWVMSIDGFLSDEECNRLIEIGESQGYRKSTVTEGSEKQLSRGRTSFSTFCDEACVDEPLVNGVIERMTNLTGIPYDNYESLQLVRYEPGQFYKKHHDESGVLKYSGPRILTFFLYLNDVLGGGGTEFQYLNFTVTPKKGSALIWPSMLDSLEGRDLRTFHEALPVEKGFKYGANSWIRLRDVQNAICPS